MTVDDDELIMIKADYNELVMTIMMPIDGDTRINSPTKKILCVVVTGYRCFMFIALVGGDDDNETCGRIPFREK